MKFLVKTRQHNGVWEEVDQFTFDHMDKAVLNDGQPRYTGDYVIEDGGDIRIHGHISTIELGRICRFMNVMPLNNVTQQIEKPTHIPFCLRQGKPNVTLRDMVNGMLYKQVHVKEVE